MKKVNWGVIGTAGIAKGQTIPGMVLAENCNLYAIAGRSIEKAEEFQKEFGFERASSERSGCGSRIYPASKYPSL